MVELVGGGSVINGAYPVYFSYTSPDSIPNWPSFTPRYLLGRESHPICKYRISPQLCRHYMSRGHVKGHIVRCKN